MIATFLYSTRNTLLLGSERPKANTPHYLRPGWSDSCPWDMYSRQHFIVIPGAETAPPDILKRKSQRVNLNPGAHMRGQKIPFCLLEVSGGDDCSVYRWGVSMQHLCGLCTCTQILFTSLGFPIPFFIRCLSEVWTLTFRTESCAELGCGISLYSSPGFLDYVPFWNATEIKTFIFPPQICIIRQLGLEGATLALSPL